MNAKVSKDYLDKSKKAYSFAFGLIFLFTLAAQIFIQYFLYSQKDYARVINLAGRQRMLSQRIARFANQADRQKNDRIAKKLEQSKNLFLQTHNDLTNGNPVKKIAPPFNKKILVAYIEIGPLAKELAKSADCIINHCSKNSEALNYINQNTDIFLKRMNSIVFMSDEVATYRNKQLAIIEIAIFLIIAMVMIAEVFLLILPFNKKMVNYLLEKKKSEDIKQRLYHLAELGEMSSEVSHEINNYLSVVDSNAFILSKYLEKERDNFKKELETLERLKKGIEKAKNVAGGMTKLSRITLMDDFYLKDIFNDLEEMFQAKFEKFNIEVTIKGNIHAKIRSNKTQIAQVLFNLTKNAIHAMEKVKNRRINIEAEKIGKIVSIKISDSGPGIPDELKDKVTEAFFTTKEEGKGTGLGLSLSKKIAKALGGDLKIVPGPLSITFELTFEDQNASQRKINAA